MDFTGYISLCIYVNMCVTIIEEVMNLRENHGYIVAGVGRVCGRCIGNASNIIPMNEIFSKIKKSCKQFKLY